MKICPVCNMGYPSDHAACPTDGARLIGSRDLEPGAVIRGKYQIVRQLGRGGMGTVYLADHLLLGRQRALKFISSDLSQDPRFLRRFRQEAQAAIELRHPNVAEVVDLDQDEDGTPYIAMEYVEGPDLGHALARGLPPVARALEIARGVALALGAAHAKGIVHRDVKPGNILLSGRKGSRETPKLLDFGIAAIKETATTLGGTQGLMLTPQYAAPEQWRGMPAGEVDGRADLYALGGVLYQMLTGETCFHAQNTEGWMYQHLHGAVQAPSRLRPTLANWRGLDALVLRLLAKEREGRPKDAAEVVALIDAVLITDQEANQETAMLTALQPKQATALPGQRRVSWWMLGVAGAVVAAAVAGGAILLSQHSRSGSAGQTAPLQTLTQSPTAAPGKVPESTQGVNSGGFETPKAQDSSAELINQVADAMASTAKKEVPVENLPATAQQAEALHNQKRYVEAKPLLEQACSANNADACFYLGKMFGEALGVPLDYARAATFYTRACDGGNEKGCNNLGLFYSKGLGTVQDYARAVSLFTRVCDSGNGKGCSNLAEMYAQGQGVNRDDARAAELYGKGCDGGESNACGRLGLMLTGGHGVFQDIPRAAGLFSKACDAGNAMGCNDLGILYISGNGIGRDAARAVTLFNQACAGGVDLGCDNAGLVYSTGDGASKDFSRAISLFTSACNHGFASSCDHLGKMYWDGNGVGRDDSRAASLYAKACDGGNADACLQLGVLYRVGDGVAQNNDSAMRYFRKACTLGSKIACDKVKTVQ